MIIGVVDRVVQKKHTCSYSSGNSICYVGGYGQIWCGKGNGKYSILKVGYKVETDMDLVVKVDMVRAEVTFIHYHQNGVLQYTVQSPILHQPGR